MLVEEKIKELSVVRTTRAVEVGRKVIPTGTLGTVVHCYGDGITFEVEFPKPYSDVVTLNRKDING